MVLPQPVPQSDIQGTLIAAARGSFMYDEDGEGYYNFLDDQAFVWKLNPIQIEQFGLEIDALYDCCEQAVERYGDPAEYRQKLGLPKYSGYSNLGIYFTSKEDPRITCVFTPTSNEGGEWDAYFEWYLKDQSIVDQDTLPEFMKDFQELAGNPRMPVESPANLPTYKEAVEVAGKVLSESAKDRFLEKFWRMGRSPSRGVRLRVEEDVRREWADIKRLASLQEAEEDSKLAKTAKYIAKKFNGDVPETGEVDRVLCKINSQTGIDFTCELEIDDKGKLNYSLKRDDEPADEFIFDSLNKQNVLSLVKMISDQLFMADALNGDEKAESVAFRVASKMTAKGMPLTESVSQAAIKYGLDRGSAVKLKSLMEDRVTDKWNQTYYTDEEEAKQVSRDNPFQVIKFRDPKRDNDLFAYYATTKEKPKLYQKAVKGWIGVESGERLDDEKSMFESKSHKKKP